jgi:hypothetical protein
MTPTVQPDPVAQIAVDPQGWPAYQPGPKGFFVLYGPPGGGKSTEAAKVFQKSLHIASAVNNLQFYKMWQPNHAVNGYQIPYREVVIDEYGVTDSWSAQRDQYGQMVPQINLDANGLPVPVPQKATLEGYLIAVVQKALAERAAGLPPTYHNLIIDEGGTFWERVFREIKPTCTTQRGALDTRAAYGVTGEWSNILIGLIRQVILAGMNICLVAHDQDPDPSSGKKGGPKFVSKAIMNHLCAGADGVILREMESKVLDLGSPTPANGNGQAAPAFDPNAANLQKAPRRIWKVHLEQNWLSKLRGIPDSMYEQVKDMELRDIIRLSGYMP